MRKPGTEGAPTAKAFKLAAKTAKKWLQTFIYLTHCHKLRMS
jgi:hypothetical protein